jgi:uncharacterized protein (UPF0248 family)
MARKKLLELKWHPQKSLMGVEVIYLHRGAPDDRATVRADEILRLEKSFFVVRRMNVEISIPYHRILELRKHGRVLWRKET